MKQIYIAHKSEDGLRVQSIREHLKGTGLLAHEFAAVFGAGDYAAVCGRYHDIGKYAHLFQRRIGGNRNIQYEHSAAGAYTFWARQEPALLPAALCIAGHHGGLPDFATKADSGLAKTFYAKMNRQEARTSPDEDYSMWREEVPPRPSSRKTAGISYCDRRHSV